MRPTLRCSDCRLFTSRPEWEPLLTDVMRDLPTVRVTSQTEPTGELRSVLPKGYPGLNLAGGGNRWMHAPGDGPETTGPAVLVPLARALAAALERIEGQQP